MIRILFAALLAAAAATPAFAQQPIEKTYTLTVTDADLGVLAEALGEVQFKKASPLIGKLQAQVNKQVEEAKKAAEPAKADK